MIRIAELIASFVAVALLVALFMAKSGTASREQELARLQAELARERGRISALEAEIAHQENPDNLRRLARIYLGFEPLRQDQEYAFSELPRVHPDEASEAGERDLLDDPQLAQASYPTPGRP